MEQILAYELSLASLLVLNVIPFLYFIYQAKFWYRPDVLPRLDFMLGALSVIVAAILLLKFSQNSALRRGDPFKLWLLHMLPLGQTLMILSKARLYAPAAKGKGGKSGTGKDDKKTYEAYRPIPLAKGIEKVDWDQIIIDEALKAELKSVVNLLKDPKTAKQYGIEVPKGILLNGPPGTGKTTIAKVIATTANLSFFVLQMDEIVSKWVGESEKNLSKLFEAAMRHAPSVIFIDEVDSIGKSRSGNQVWADNLLNHLLQMVDGVVKKEGLYIIAATNRADLVDAALKRSGRLNKIIEVPLPDVGARKKLFQLYLSKLSLEGNVNLDILAEATQGKSGADIKEICNQAGLNAFRRESGSKKRDFIVSYADIESALNEFLNPHPMK